MTKEKEHCLRQILVGIARSTIKADGCIVDHWRKYLARIGAPVEILDWDWPSVDSWLAGYSQLPYTFGNDEYPIQGEGIAWEEILRDRPTLSPKWTKAILRFFNPGPGIGIHNTSGGNW